MEKSKKIKLFVGLFYIILVSIFLYYLFSKYSFQQLTSYNFIKNNIDYLSELKKSNLPEELRIGAILRDNKIIIPRSNFIFKKKDRVVFIVKKDSISFVENIFRLSPV